MYVAPYLLCSALQEISQPPTNFRLIDNLKVESTTAKCLLTKGIKHNCQLGVEVKAPNGLV